jgi:glutamate carboxypeptidase
MYVVLVLLVCSGSPPAEAARSTRVEKDLVAYIRTQQEPAIALLEQSVNINSGTMNFAGVRAVAEVFRPRFEALGFQTQWIDGKPFGRAGHLLAVHEGHGKHVVLIGHLDTVFEPNHPFQRAERTDANTLRGPGTADMKGGIVVALTALEALKKVGALDALKITVVLHGDEEDAGEPLSAARATLIGAAKGADVAIGLENAADDPATAVTARRSSGRWQIRASGRTEHSSQIFTEEVGAGAIYELARILNGFYTELRGDEFLTFNPGLIAGSTQVEYVPEPLQARISGKDNIIAPIAIASGDLRAISPQQIVDTQRRMREIVAAHLPHTDAQITFDDSYPPMAPTDGNARLLGMYDQVSQDLGFGAVSAVNPRRAGAADISFVANEVGMALDGMGLLGGGSHTPNEFADLRTLQIQAQRLAVLLYRLGKQ